MEGIELKDIISEESDNEMNQEDKIKMEENKNTPGYEQYMKCLEKTTHPLDHYNEMKNVKDEKDNKLNVKTPTSALSEKMSMFS
jgi:hypothetical protein